MTSDIDFYLENEKFELSTGFSAYEDLLNKIVIVINMFYTSTYKSFLDTNNFASFDLISQGDNILKDTNSLRSRMINNLNVKSYDYYSKIGTKNNFNYYLKNTIFSGKNNSEYDSSPDVKLMNIFEFVSSFPLIHKNQDYINYLNPKASFRINPSSMKNYKNENRRINNDNIFNVNRLGLIDTLESGENLTLGLEYKKEKIDNINKYFELKLGTVLRNKSNRNIPSNSTIDKKRSNYFGSITNNLNDNMTLKYEFSINNGLDEIQYNSLGTSFSKNNFVTTFNYIEENGVIGSTNILENVTTFSFDEQNHITFKTRNNREIDLTEYYDLIYEYKNDCLVAGLKYNKTYYKDKDLEPSEDFMLSIKLIPLTGIEQKFAN